jgi:hypothetical protein
MRRPQTFSHDQFAQLVEGQVMKGAGHLGE